ncbi:MAG: cyanophycin synthetase [Phenylobacterium sp.]|jgi:cyanophycin synthetase
MIKLELDDCRRLTGKGLLWDHPGAIIDVFVDGIDKNTVLECWQKHLARLLAVLGWSSETTISRIFEDGVTLAMSAPFDALYAATEVLEAAWNLTCEELAGETPLDSPTRLDSLSKTLDNMIQDEVNPKLLALINEAQSRNAPWLTDDDEFSLGFGQSCTIWPIDQLPDIEQIDWAKYQVVPVAMITGTNGKSTSVRLTSEIVKQTGKRCGVTSTDFIRVGDTIIDKGDYSGPGGARMLLRNSDVEIALLEVARGGILRRGLPIPQVDAALITNIAEDHLGQYGINTIAGLTETKFVVAKALSEGGVLVLNADDRELVRHAKQIDKRKCWFAINENNPVLVEHASKGGAICFVRDGIMVWQDNDGSSDIIAVNDVPSTFNGAAKHNIQNALGAIALAKNLGIDTESVRAGLGEFRSNVTDNPGRGNIFAVKDATVIMDFAHNEHSMRAIASTTANMPSEQKWLMISSAGDRSDGEINTMTKAALCMSPDLVVISEVEIYLRGRELGETSKLIAQAAIEYGIDASKIHYTQSPSAGAEYILGQIGKGDLALMLVLSEREEIVELLQP